MRTIAALLFAAPLSLLAACGATALPDPRILSVAPAGMVACEGTTVNVAIEAVLPTHLDYNRSQATAELDLKLRIGPMAVGSGKYANGGILTAVVPPLLAPGLYDVGLQFWDRLAEAVLPGAFTVRQNPSLMGYAMDPIPDQQRNVPFWITIHAVGQDAPLFKCSVSLSSNAGLIAPTATGPFQQGVRREQVMLSVVSAGATITVSDANGRVGTSNMFAVFP